MEQLETEHVVALAVTASVAAVAVWAARARPGRWVSRFSGVLAVVIVTAYVVEQVTIALRGTWTVERSLPLHLTDVVTIVAALALLTAVPILFELAYFWGLTASLQATLTPDLGNGYPSVFYFTYFLTHGGAVVAAVFMAFGRRMTPRVGAVWRVFGLTVAFALVAGLGDLITGGNYMFLRERPESGSLLDLFGPWPWYLLGAAALTIAMFLILDLPFRGRRSRRRVAPPRAAH